MNSKLISLAAGAALMSASALTMAGDFKYRGGFDDRHDRHERHEQRYNDDDRGHRFSGRRHWAPSENQHHRHWKPRWNQQWNHHRHDRWCHHGAPRHHYGPHGSSYDDSYGNGSITLILRGDLN